MQLATMQTTMQRLTPETEQHFHSQLLNQSESRAHYSAQSKASCSAHCNDVTSVPVTQLSSIASSNMLMIETLLNGLSMQRRWVYYFSEFTRIRSSHNNIIQVPLKSRTRLMEWVDKVVNNKQCSAIFIERNSLDSYQEAIIKKHCDYAGIILIIVEPSVLQ